MTSFLEWILDLDRIRLATDRPLMVKWLMPLPPWLVFTVSLILLIAVALTYRREESTLRRRVLLLMPRVLLIALVMVMVCQPVLILQRNRIEPATVVLMVDNSRSMNQPDGLWNADGPAPINAQDKTRLDQIKQSLTENDAEAVRSLLAHNRVSLASFDGTLNAHVALDSNQAVNPLTEALKQLTGGGSRSEIFSALSQTLSRSQAGPLAAIVLASDGQSTESEGIEPALDRAKAQKVPIYPILVGSPIPPLDLSVSAVVKDRQVFAEDRVAIGAEIIARGLTASAESTLVVIDESTGAELTSRPIRLNTEAPRQDVELLIHVERQGRARYRLTLQPLPGETDLNNNTAILVFDVVQEPLKVLYVEGYPRFEYRYIKNSLVREKTVSVSCLLLSADNEFAQEGDEPIRRFPQIQEELDQYDVVLFGDVDPSGAWWTPRQADLLVEFVRGRGGGFGLIAGEKFAPHRYLDTVLQRLVPVRIDPRFQGKYGASLTESFHLRLTPEGRANRAFRFFDDPDVNAATLESLPGMYWLAQTLGPKPGSEILAYHDSMRTMSGPMPLIVQGRYGAGTVLFIGTDDFWQWRRHSGEGLHDAFWVQIARALAPSTASDSDPRLSLTTNKPEYRLGESVEVMLRVRDSELLATLGDEVSLLATDETDAPSLSGRLLRISPEAADYSAVLLPEKPGGYSLQLPDIPPSPTDKPVRTSVRVSGFERELEHPEANHEVLRRLADETGGSVIPVEQLSETLAKIPDRSIQTPDDVTEALWDSKLVLILFVSIITLEWIGRKAAGLL